MYLSIPKQVHFSNAFEGEKNCIILLDIFKN